MVVAEVNNVIYSAKTRTSGGRRGGTSRSLDGRLELRFTNPTGIQVGTNPEQLLAAGWSVCFVEALIAAAQRMKVAVSNDIVVDAQIDLCLARGEFFLRAKLRATLPGIDRATAEALMVAANDICLYSKAVRGNVDVVLEVA
jgi:Ohr subfamily peroxiredoxin